jgi:hypothetical protein
MRQLRRQLARGEVSRDWNSTVWKHPIGWQPVAVLMTVVSTAAVFYAQSQAWMARR